MADRKSRSRSPPPTRDGPSRKRSRSPRRRDENERIRDNRDRRDRPRGSGGFKWKEKRKDDRGGGEKRLERGYRNRSRSPQRERQPESKGASVEDKFGVADKFGPPKKKEGEEKSADTSNPPERAPAPAPSAAHGEPMIIVHVNDRLGTKAAIPCLASDPIKLFKAQVAARIGRQPHEILLKRQGERPFKDQLTLEDYGVSNGVQIDLEIDTGE
ncbi:ubiquitin-like protein [Hyaloscypha variabilis]|jgi:hypothetical protein